MTVLVALALLLLAPWPASALDEQIRTIPSRPGVTESFVLIRTPRPPAASVILFTGGRGALGLQRGPLGPRAINFLVRSRQRFAERGLLVAVLDAPSDRTGEALVRFRTSAEHAADVRALIAALRAETPVPVWLVGTSMGSVSAAAVAVRLTEGGPDGVVLTSSVMGQSREMGESLQDVALDKIRVPVLIVHHRDDGCRASRYADTAWAMRRLSAAPRKELLAFSGGDAPQSDACEPLAPHGYFGIEDKVVDAIVGFITRP
ncbi:MAG TPA: alpha/beta hydrolase [Patescibacteria group bacterium]|nr:alpha/beta hydrolase [Patescibacteria group bacterium]